MDTAGGGSAEALASSAASARDAVEDGAALALQAAGSASAAGDASSVEDAAAIHQRNARLSMIQPADPEPDLPSLTITHMIENTSDLPGLAALPSADESAGLLAAQLSAPAAPKVVRRKKKTSARTERHLATEQTLPAPAAAVVAEATTATLESTGESTAKSAKDNAVANNRQDMDMLTDYEEMKIATMYKMKQDIRYTSGDTIVTCPFLYLTNEQAALIPCTKMSKIREVMGIGSPKMVIRLLPSFFGPIYANAYPHEAGRFPCRVMSASERDNLSRRLTLLAKEVLLPLAMKTHALVVGMDCCELAVAFGRVVAPIQRQLGNKCPFSIMLFCRAFMFESQANGDGTVEAFKRSCPAWRRADFASALARTFGDDEAFWPQEDLVAGSDFMVIMFECLRKKIGGRTVLSSEVPARFQNDFISSLAEHLPVIGLQTTGTQRMDLMPAIADHVTRGMPLMLLDSRDRDLAARSLEDSRRELQGPQGRGPAAAQEPQRQFQASSGKDISAFYDIQVREEVDADVPEKLRPCAEVLLATARELRRQGRSDRCSTSVLAYVKRALNDLVTDKETSRCKQQKKMWIWEAIQVKSLEEVALRREVVENKHGTKSENADLVVAATRLVLRTVGRDLEWEAKFLQARCREGLTEIGAAKSWAEFAKLVEDNWMRLRAICFFQYDDLIKFGDDHGWCYLRDLGEHSPRGKWILQIDVERGERLAIEAPTAIRYFVAFVTGELNRAVEYDLASKSEEAFVARQDLWLAVYDILKDTKNVHTSSLNDISDCERTLFTLAQNIDRLPQENTLSALVLLRRAWTLADLFHSSAHFYKLCAKISYAASLVLGLLVVVVSTLAIMRDKDDLDGTSTDQNVLLGLALASAALTGWTAVIEPARKWTQLRGGALVLQKEIWKFRTRVGDYAGSATSLSSFGRHGAEREAEEILQAFIEKMQEHVLQSAGLKETSFYSRATCVDDVHKELHEIEPAWPQDAPTKSSWKHATFRHGQYCGHMPTEKPHPGDENAPRQDNHHSPASPHDYVRFRLVSAKNFYQGRIPRYAFRRRLVQAVLLVSSILSALLAATGNQKWTAVASTVAAAFAAWQEFIGMAKKLERYSSVAAALDGILMWWQALPTVDQSNVANVEEIVERTEALIGGENAAWLSQTERSQKANQRNRGQQSEQGDKEKDDARDGGGQSSMANT